MTYNLELLREEATGIVVAEYIGMDIRRKGAYNFILCPGHIKVLGRRDNTISNCVLTNKGYKCFSCGQTKDVFEMVSEYYEFELNQKLSFMEVCGIIGDALGGRHLYWISGENKPIIRISKLSPDDYEIIGLNPSYKINKIINSGFDKEEALKNHLNPIKSKESDNSYVYVKNENLSLQTLSIKSPELYRNIILKYSEAAMKKYEKMQNMFGSRNASHVEELFVFGNNGKISDELILNLKIKINQAYERSKEIYRDFYYSYIETEESEEINLDKKNNNEIKINEKEIENKEIVPKKKINYFELFG